MRNSADKTLNAVRAELNETNVQLFSKTKELEAGSEVLGNISLHPQERSSGVAITFTLRDERIAPGLELRFTEDDGTEVWTHIGAAAAGADINELKRSEAALRRSEERYRTLFTAMDQGFCIIEKVKTAPGKPSDYRFLAANPAFQRHTSLGDPVGKTILELTPTVEKTIMDRYDRVTRTGKQEHFEDYISALDLWIEAEVLPVEGGRIAVLFSNVSDRKRAELALRESETRFRRLFSNNMVAMALWAKSGAIIGANDAFLEMIGYTRAELEAGKIRWDTITPAEYRARDQKAISEIELKGFFTPYEKSYLHKNGRPIPIIIGGGSFDEKAGTGVSFAVDLTERKRHEEHIQMLLREVNHRSKNLLALVQAVTLQTSASDPAEFIDLFLDRIIALAAS